MTATVYAPDQTAAFMDAIAAHPADDCPRLVYADWLEEQGDPRGEFIRVQVELANHVCICNPPCSSRMDWSCTLPLHHREKELLEEHGAEWSRPTATLFHPDNPLPSSRPVEYGYAGCVNPQGGKILWTWHRGFIEVVKLPMTTFIGRCCERCIGHGFVLPSRRHPESCLACHGTGSIPGLAGPLFRAYPLIREVQTNWKPGRFSYAHFGWYKQWPQRVVSPHSDLPPAIWDRLKGGREAVIGPWYVFPTAEAAQASLNSALVEYGQEEAAKVNGGK